MPVECPFLLQHPVTFQTYPPLPTAGGWNSLGFVLADGQSERSDTNPWKSQIRIKDKAQESFLPWQSDGPVEEDGRQNQQGDIRNDGTTILEEHSRDGR